MHFETRELAEHLRFRPNVEVGVGDDVTLVAFNFEFTYRLPPAALPRSLSMWHLYVGGGPALNIFDFSDDTRSEGASTGWSGSPIATGLFAEAKFGALKSPTFKFAVGYVPSVKRPRSDARDDTAPARSRSIVGRADLELASRSRTAA